MAVFTDQLGRSVRLDEIPTRIVSVVPSQTELLYHLGLEDAVVGITRFCVHPDQWFQTKTRVGGTKQLHLDRIKSLQPHLVIANKEENVKEQIEALEQIAPVWVSDVNDYREALQMIASVGELTGKTDEAIQLCTNIQAAFDLLRDVPPLRKAAYLIWKDPYMVAGCDTFIHQMMRYCGLENAITEWKRYPEVTIDMLLESGCEFVLLSSEPYPFRENHRAALEAQLPGVQVVLADGEMFSWYGSRMLQAASYFQSLRQQLDL